MEKDAKWKLRCGKRGKAKLSFRYVKIDFSVYVWLISLFISDIKVNMKTRSIKHLVDHDEGDEDRPTTPKLQLPRRNEVVSSPQVEIVVAYLH